MGEMQDLGGPPSEIMGDLPEGFVSVQWGWGVFVQRAGC